MVDGVGLSRRGMWRLALGLLLASCLSVMCSSRAAAPTIPLRVGGQVVEVELALSPSEHAQGLMYRQEMDSDHGMLFVFKEDEYRSFWMKNTFLPLSIAFIDKDKKILNMADMAPLREEPTYKSVAPARYVLEMNQGWFVAHGVKAGDGVEFTLPQEHK